MKLRDLFENKTAQAKFDAVVYNPKTVFFHESPGLVWESFYDHGIEDNAVFCTVNKESNFVVGDKTIICFHIPKGNKVLISPDMRYEGVDDLVQEHPKIAGADVSINRNIPSAWILSIEEETVNGKMTRHSLD